MTGEGEGDRWSLLVAKRKKSEREELGKNNKGLYSEGVYHMGCCESDMKYSLSSAWHSAPRNISISLC